MNTYIVEKGDAVDASRYCGAWSASMTYSVGDIITFNECFYKAIGAVGTADPEHTANWVAYCATASFAALAKIAGLTPQVKSSLFSSDGFKSAAFGTAVSSAANIESGKVATVDGSTGTAESKQTVTVTFKAKETSDTSLRYCELLITGVTADEAVTVSLPAGKYYFADGADKTSAGNNHFVFAECGDGWMVSKSVLTAITLS